MSNIDTVREMSSGAGWAVDNFSSLQMLTQDWPVCKCQSRLYGNFTSLQSSWEPEESAESLCARTGWGPPTAVVSWQVNKSRVETRLTNIWEILSRPAPPLPAVRSLPQLRCWTCWPQRSLCRPPVLLQLLRWAPSPTTDRYRQTGPGYCSRPQCCNDSNGFQCRLHWGRHRTRPQDGAAENGGDCGECGHQDASLS